MNNHSIEQLMYQISDLLLTPVLVILVILFFYSFYKIGGFITLWAQRKSSRTRYQTMLQSGQIEPLAGYPVFNQYAANTEVSQEKLEVFALKSLENLRIVTRVAPMLGLIATMIPMGPALRALGDGNVQGISENLIVAFSAVIFGLVAASLTFWPASVKKRWYAAELTDVEELREGGAR